MLENEDTETSSSDTSDDDAWRVEDLYCISCNLRNVEKGERYSYGSDMHQ